MSTVAGTEGVGQVQERDKTKDEMKEIGESQEVRGKENSSPGHDEDEINKVMKMDEDTVEETCTVVATTSSIDSEKESNDDATESSATKEDQPKPETSKEMDKAMEIDEDTVEKNRTVAGATSSIGDATVYEAASAELLNHKSTNEIDKVMEMDEDTVEEKNTVAKTTSSIRSEKKSTNDATVTSATREDQPMPETSHEIDKATEIDDDMVEKNRTVAAVTSSIGDATGSANAEQLNPESSHEINKEIEMGVSAVVKTRERNTVVATMPSIGNKKRSDTIVKKRKISRLVVTRSSISKKKKITRGATSTVSAAKKKIQPKTKPRQVKVKVMEMDDDTVEKKGKNKKSTVAATKPSIGSKKKSARDATVSVMVKKEPEPKPDLFDEITDNIFISQIKDETDNDVCFCDDGECGVSCVLRYLTVECRDGCPSGDKCTNRAMQKKVGAKVEIYYTGAEKGFGVRALETIKTGSFISEYMGEVVTQKVGEKRQEKYAAEFPARRNHYLMRVTDSKNRPFFIDATKRGSMARFINHSCEPNASCEKWSVDGRFRMGFFAKKKIEAGEEITFNYRFENCGRELVECACGAPSCIRYLSTKNQAKEAEEERVRSDESKSPFVETKKEKTKMIKKEKENKKEKEKEDKKTIKEKEKKKIIKKEEEEEKEKDDISKDAQISALAIVPQRMAAKNADTARRAGKKIINDVGSSSMPSSSSTTVVISGSASTSIAPSSTAMTKGSGKKRPMATCIPISWDTMDDTEKQQRITEFKIKSRELLTEYVKEEMFPDRNIFNRTLIKQVSNCIEKFKKKNPHFDYLLTNDIKDKMIEHVQKYIEKHELKPMISRGNRLRLVYSNPHNITPRQ